MAHIAAAVGVPVYARNPAGCGCRASAECGGPACGCREGVPATCGPCGRPVGDCCCSADITNSAVDTGCVGPRRLGPTYRSCCSTERPRVQWVVAFAARSCKPRGPLGLPAVEPAVPPAEDRTFDAVPAAGFVVPVTPQFSVHVTDPPDPPPRGV